MELPLSKSKTSAHCRGQYYQHRPEICWVIIGVIISFGSSVGHVRRVVGNDSVEYGVVTPIIVAVPYVALY